MHQAYARAAVLLAIVGLIAIRAPHGQRSRGVPIRRHVKSGLETFLLSVAWISFFLPLVWLVTGWPSFADYPLHAAAYVAGLACIAMGLYLFHRSHVDLGTNWSITLDLREGHRLVTEGVYRRVRHPMYSALLLYALGLALVLPNAVAGPSYLVSMTLLAALRIAPEEKMMREEFGDAYVAYAGRTSRLVPWVW